MSEGEGNFRRTGINNEIIVSTVGRSTKDGVDDMDDMYDGCLSDSIKATVGSTKKKTKVYDMVSMNIMKAIFAIYHRLEFQPGNVRDLQFMVNDIPGNLDKFTQLEQQQYASRIFPASAIGPLYKLHFKGTVLEQFSWLFNQSGGTEKSQSDQSYRIRFFDLSLVEMNCINATAKNPLTDETWGVNLDYTFGYYRAPLGYSTFDLAVKYLNEVLAIQRSRAEPRYYPREITVKENEFMTLQNSVILHFPELGLNDDWIDGEIKKKTHHQGSFLAVLTRSDRFKIRRKNQSDASITWKGDLIPEYCSCTFEVTWIVNDPIYTATIDGSANTFEDQTAQNTGDPGERVIVRPESTLSADLQFGPTESWSAKAIKMFPQLSRFTVDIADQSIMDSNGTYKGGDLGDVRLLVLTVNERYSAIIEQSDKLLEQHDLRVYAERHSTSIGIASISSILPLDRIMKYL
ncbi:hypothetical protein GGI12_004869 [Dipsacomyces acuminosporus]|nr:hypothetical protein GGI12_004869 [Dipsacomyces acuminosporus]